MTLAPCRSCGGFVPSSENVCPHCGVSKRSKVRRVVGVLGAALGGGAFAMTLMACYGGPVRPAPAPGPTPTGSTSGSPEGSVSTTPVDSPK